MPHSVKQMADYRAKLDHFAELLSQDIPIPQIRQRMGLGRGHAYNLLQAIRRGLGWQAQ